MRTLSALRGVLHRKLRSSSAVLRSLPPQPFWTISTENGAEGANGERSTEDRAFNVIHPAENASAVPSGQFRVIYPHLRSGSPLPVPVGNMLVCILLDILAASLFLRTYVQPYQAPETMLENCLEGTRVGMGCIGLESFFLGYTVSRVPCHLCRPARCRTEQATQ